jgi:hypothetical protein
MVAAGLRDEEPVAQGERPRSDDLPPLERLFRTVEQRHESRFGASVTAWLMILSAVRRDRATPDSIGFGDPIVGSKAGPTT